MWKSPVPETRWAGFRRLNKGIRAFSSVSEFENAAKDELSCSLEDHELTTLGRLLHRGKKNELEIFIRTHGANPLFDPHKELESPVGVAKADVVPIENPLTEESFEAVLEGRIAHVLFQAGEATRFQEGPFYLLNPISVAQRLLSSNAVSAHVAEDDNSRIDRNQLGNLLKEISRAQSALPASVGEFIVNEPLGPKQPLLLRAALRRLIQGKINSGSLDLSAAIETYKKAVAAQKILFFVSSRGGVNASHDQALRKDKSFYGFNPVNIVTIEQELVRGITADENGRLGFIEGNETVDAAGHLYALMQAARSGDFTTYTESGRPIKPMEMDAFSYLIGRGAKIMSVIRINDMDRHTTEILNPKAFSYALKMFSKGYVNIIETVANPNGQKGGTGITFGDPEVHVLTETHENSFPALSRAFESAMKIYLEENNGRHPAYNAMRQWADLVATRRVLREYGGRIVFVPREGSIQGQSMFYLGVDMPMGDLSLLTEDYRSRMFQFCGPNGGELLIHDMKSKVHLPMALQTVLHQLGDPHIIAAAQEALSGKLPPFKVREEENSVYSAPSPEFN